MADGALDHIQDIGEENRYTVLKYVDQEDIYSEFSADRYPKAFFVKAFCVLMPASIMPVTIALELFPRL